ncbi:MAG: LysR family transcriptional regulator [Solirubrobacterales bacterium]|nr:LysR family transcriptional regulator [Solirubrobacterales bacterium]
MCLVDGSVELRQLRYFVAVAEELHFGRAAERLHMSQSPLSRAVRELERDLGVVLFVRTTRRVELTEAGSLLLERSRRALAEIDGAIADAQWSARTDEGVLGIGYGPFSRTVVTRIAAALGEVLPEMEVRLDEEVTADSLRRLGAHELAAAVVMESPTAARRLGVRIDTLKDEPLLAALPQGHRFATEGVIPVGAFAAERVLLPREPPGQVFNAWLRALIRVHGFELERTIKTLSAPWDRRMLPVANGEAVAVVVAEWAKEWAPGLVAVPFDPPLNFPTDLASRWPPTESVTALVAAARRVRDADGWLSERTDRTELPSD